MIFMNTYYESCEGNMTVAPFKPASGIALQYLYIRVLVIHNVNTVLGK